MGIPGLHYETSRDREMNQALGSIEGVRYQKTGKKAPLISKLKKKKSRSSGRRQFPRSFAGGFIGTLRR